MAGFALDLFEAQAEAFCRARSWREHRFLSGQRPGRGLVSLYDEDFADFTSTDLWADLQAATPEDARQHLRLSALLASAYLEGRTREHAVSTTRVHAGANVAFEERDLPWREVPAHWPLLGEVPRRHELEEGWRNVVKQELTPILERWQEALRGQLTPLGSDDWLAFWSNLRGFSPDPGATAKLANAVLEQTADVYGHGLGVYLGQLGLPIDDLWVSDVDFAFRAPRFDAVFPEIARVPTVIRTLRDLGIELEEQANVHVDYGIERGVQCLPLEIPEEIRVLMRLGGGWQDFARTLYGLGMAEHLAHADGSLRVWERWLGDATPTFGYGSLMEGLLRDRTWLVSRIDYATNEDFLIIANLEWLYRVRRVAAKALYEQRLWQAEPGASMASDFEETLTAATRVRHFPEEYLILLLNSPWSTLQSVTLLRAEVFAAQLRLWLMREFDEEWWRSNRAAHFLRDELWRPGRRHTAEELLGFMGFEGFDAGILGAEFVEVLQPL